MTAYIKLFTTLVLLAVTPPAPASAAQGGARKELRVYHIGNSVTDTIRYKLLQQMAKSKGDNYVFGRHMIPGAPLQFIWDKPSTGFRENPYGYYPAALRD